MRYLQYKTSKRMLFRINKAYYQGLPTEKKRTFRKNKFWKILGTVVVYLVLVTCLMLGGTVIKSIPTMGSTLWKILLMIAKVLLWCLLLVLSMTITVVVASPILKKGETYCDSTMNAEMRSLLRCRQRNFYEMTEPYLVTKCFDCTDNRFINHDVCIFVANDELCISADLVSRHASKDLGCYCFRRGEIALTRLQDENRFVLELKAVDASKEVVFRLGYRAKGFIERNFLLQRSDK